MITKTYCDHCNKEITLQNYFHEVLRSKHINMRGLGLLSSSTIPQPCFLCDDCSIFLDKWLSEGFTKHLNGTT